MSAETCVICDDSVLVEIEPDSEEEEEEGNGKSASEIHKALDDVEPSCGCHYHW